MESGSPVLQSNDLITGPLSLPSNHVSEHTEQEIRAWTSGVEGELLGFPLESHQFLQLSRGYSFPLVKSEALATLHCLQDRVG